MRRFALLALALSLAACSSASVTPPAPFTGPTSTPIAFPQDACATTLPPGPPASVYELPANVDAQSRCIAVAAYRAGQILLAYNDPLTLTNALGAGVTSDLGATTLGLSTDGDPGVEGPLDSALRTADDGDDGWVHGYAATRSADGTLSEFETEDVDVPSVRARVTEWIGGNLPLDAKRAPRGVSKPSFDTRAWTLIETKAWNSPVETAWMQLLSNGSFRWNKSRIDSWAKFAGRQSGVMSLYRLNTNDATVDYFLVDTEIAQAPNHFSCRPGSSWCQWYNVGQTLEVSLSSGTAQGVVIEAAPQTRISSESQTISVGGSLNAKVSGSDKGPGGEAGGTINAGWSRTVTMQSVETTPLSGAGSTVASWRDFYNHDPARGLPASSYSLFSSGKLAIFTLPRTIYNGTSTPQVVLSGGHTAQFYGFWTSGVEAARADPSRREDITGRYFLPVFSVSPTTLSLRRGQSAKLNVVSQADVTSKAVTFYAAKTPSFVTTNLDANGASGNRTIDVNAKPDAPVGSVDYLTLNTTPAGGADSLRNGSVAITITIVP